MKLINLAWCNVTDEHIESLQPCIPYLENLIISGSKEMSSQSMTCISDAVMETNIYNKRNLKLLNLRSCHLTDEHIESLQPCIPYLENLIITGNKEMSSQSMKSISDSVMEANSYNTNNLKLIDVSYCNLTDKHIESLQPCIQYLENLIIYGNREMSSHSMKSISDAVMEANIYNTNNLKLIDVSYCNLIDKDIESLKPCIPYLENLIITNNRLSARSRHLIKNMLGKRLELK